MVNNHQPLDQAWRFTLREFFIVTDLRKDAKSFFRTDWDEEKLGGMEQHLRNLGVEV